MKSKFKVQRKLRFCSLTNWKTGYIVGEDKTWENCVFLEFSQIKNLVENSEIEKNMINKDISLYIIKEDDIIVK